MKRLDMLELMVEHGFDPKSISMIDVFATWDPEIMEYFIERGADVESGMPLAWALRNRVRTALRIFKTYREQFPSFQEQANVALRYHCTKGDQKWVSLLLWAGADPIAPGEEHPDARRYEGAPGISAIEYAALYGHFDLLTMKPMKQKIDHSIGSKILKFCRKPEGVEIAQRLLSQGLDPNDQENGGCSAIQHLLSGLQWRGESYSWFWGDRDKNFDTVEAREQVKLIHLLARHRGRWVPRDRSDINEARKSLVKMKPDYTTEFVWIMHKYRACSKSDLEILLQTPTIKRHTASHRNRINEILNDWPEESTPAG